MSRGGGERRKSKKRLWEALGEIYDRAIPSTRAAGTCGNLCLCRRLIMPILPWRLSPWLSFFPLRPHTIDCALTEVRNQLFSQPTLGNYLQPPPPPRGRVLVFLRYIIFGPNETRGFCDTSVFPLYPRKMRLLDHPEKGCRRTDINNRLMLAQPERPVGMLGYQHRRGYCCDVG